MEPLFEYISSAIVNGELPRDFSLPASGDDHEIMWADGAQDGVALYHMNDPEISRDDLTLISDAVRSADKKDFELADKLFKMLGEHVQAVYAIDVLQSYIQEHHGQLDPKCLYQYALHLLLESADRESVKFGLAFMELFKTDGKDKLKEVVRTLGLCNEFTLFAIFVMQKWQDGNNEIWQLAKKVHGWGRIHAVEYLKPESEDIRKWLLTEGIHNDVLPAYSALPCWLKSGAEAVLNDHPSYEDFVGIRDIICGLLDEGPVQGLSALENADDIILAFLDEAQMMTLCLEDLEAIYGIYCYYRDNVAERCVITALCKKILQTYRNWCLIIDEVRQGKCIDMASDIGTVITHAQEDN